MRVEQSRPESDIICPHQKETVEPRDKIEQEKIEQATEDEQFVWDMQKMEKARILEKQLSDRRA